MTADRQVEGAGGPTDLGRDPPLLFERCFVLNVDTPRRFTCACDAASHYGVRVLIVTVSIYFGAPT
jgi:hypothetical protein